MLATLELVAADNGGVFSRTQALKAGYTEREIRKLMESGLWTKLRHGVYIDRVHLVSIDTAERALVEVAAARLCASGVSAGSFVSAAQTYGLPRIDLTNTIHLTAECRQRRGTRSSPIIVHRGDLPATHLRQKNGVLLTSPARTVVDVARMLPVPEAVAVADAALHAKLTTMTELLAVLSDVGNLELARTVIAAANGLSESVLESVSRVVLAALGVAEPELQHCIYDENGKLIARVDFWWERYRVAGETDGLLKYDMPSTGPSPLRKEKLREERLAQLGIRVVRWTWEEITKTPWVVVQRLLTAFQLASR